MVWFDKGKERTNEWTRGRYISHLIFFLIQKMPVSPLGYKLKLEKKKRNSFWDVFCCDSSLTEHLMVSDIPDYSWSPFSPKHTNTNRFSIMYSRCVFSMYNRNSPPPVHLHLRLKNAHKKIDRDTYTHTWKVPLLTAAITVFWIIFYLCLTFG